MDDYNSIYTGAEIDRRLTDVDGKIPFPSPAYAGLFPMATAQGGIQWVPRGQPTQEQTRQAVEAYFASHAVPVPSVYALGNAIIRDGWNQMISPSDLLSSATGELTLTANANGSITLNGTASETHNRTVVKERHDAIVGHKYVIRGGNASFRLRPYGTFAFDSGDGYLFVAENDRDIQLGTTVTAGTYPNVTIFPQVFDLTQLFGAGNEPTLELFRQLFPDDYYPFATPGWGDLLWENANSFQEFPEQAITINGISSYKNLLFVVRAAAGLAHLYSAIAEPAGGGIAMASEISGQPISRSASFSGDAISFAAGYHASGYSVAATVSNLYAIPYRIYGIK